METRHKPGWTPRDKPLESRSFVYRGWNITYCATRPESSRWKAERHGVELNCHSRYAATLIVDIRIKEHPPKGD